MATRKTKLGDETWLVNPLATDSVSYKGALYYANEELPAEMPISEIAVLVNDGQVYAKGTRPTRPPRARSVYKRVKNNDDLVDGDTDERQVRSIFSTNGGRSRREESEDDYEDDFEDEGEIQIEVEDLNLPSDEETAPPPVVKKKPGRPKGSKNKKVVRVG